MKKILPLFFLFTLLISCHAIIMKMYGIKNPRIENGQSIKHKALKFGLDTSNIVTVNSKDFLSAIKGQSLPDAAIFDNDGNYIEYRATDTSCNAGLFGFIPNLNLNSHYNKTGKTNLKTEWQKFRDLKGHEMNLPAKADFYILIYWVVYEGKLNKDHVKVWENLAKQNKNCAIKVIKVNLDFVQYWDEKERNEIIAALKKN